MVNRNEATQVHYQSAYFIVRWMLGILFLLLVFRFKDRLSVDGWLERKQAD